MRMLSKSPWVVVTDTRSPTLRYREFSYRATFFEAPIYAGQSGKYYETDCQDIVRQSKRYGTYGIQNTGKNVSYYGALLKEVTK